MISVCMATHNGEKYIKEQLDSIICQLSEEDEIIISDDGSSDGTIRIVESYKDERIHLVHYNQPTESSHSHAYVCRNFENALKKAKGDYIFLSDQDDWWMPNKVKKCLEDLENNILVVHQIEMCDGELESKGIYKYIDKDRFKYKNYLSLNGGKYYGCAIAFRKELMLYILPFPKKLMLHDQWIGCLAELIGTVYYEREPLIKYRVHGGNTSIGVSKNHFLFQVWYRVYMYVCLFLRKFQRIIQKK